jgi:hypothetical protein
MIVGADGANDRDILSTSNSLYGSPENPSSAPPLRRRSEESEKTRPRA